MPPRSTTMPMPWRPPSISAGSVRPRGVEGAFHMSDSQSESDIDIIRRRPGMYVGDIRDGSGLTHMIWELFANALDEHVGGSCRAISIAIHEDGSVTVQDDGRGIPTHDLDGSSRSPGSTLARSPRDCERSRASCPH